MKEGMITRGQTNPLGATVTRDGVNFSVYSKTSTLVELLLFDRVDDSKPASVIRLDPRTYRTYHYWHAFIPDLGPNQIYAYRAHGPFDPSQGHRFDPTKILLDPYSKAVAVPENYDRKAASKPGDNCATAMKSVVVDLQDYDWEGDQPLKRPSVRTIIYELHRPSPYRGIHKQNLKVRCAKLLPVFQFDSQDRDKSRTFLVSRYFHLAFR